MRMSAFLVKWCLLVHEPGSLFTYAKELKIFWPLRTDAQLCLRHDCKKTIVT